MYLSVTQINEHLYDTAKEFFIMHWRSDLLYRNSNSLIGAYLVTQYMLNNWKNWFSFKEWIYNHENRYFSTSHSWNSIAIAIDDKKIAIDLELIKPRNNILLKGISILDEKLWPRGNFYLQRCAKECLIKYLQLNAEDIISANINKTIQEESIIYNQKFNYSVFIEYQNTQFKIITCIENNTILSILR